MTANAGTMMTMSVALLRPSDQLKRALDSLDKQNGREQSKIGVIYVGHEQETQQAILGNESGSPAYEDFLAALGWPVDVQTHAGFKGGLETNLKSGSRMPYYCTSTLEVIFHVATWMPTDHDDPQQVKKKRHIGNDEINIVWNDHYRAFDPNSIPSKVTDVYIIVTPLTNGLFRVDLRNKKEIAKYGPLQDHMVVSLAVLGPAVRTTAINAARRVPKIKSATSDAVVPRVPNPYTNRLNLIKDLTSRNKQSTISLDTFMNAIIQPAPTAFPNNVTVTT